MKKTMIGVGSLALGIAAAQVTGIGNIGQVASVLGNKFGEGLFLNPYSQEKEHEADQVGLFLMARAKYDPQAAIDFWERASKDSSFGSGASFFSTHPSSSDRMQRLTSFLPGARDVYLGRDSTPVTDNTVRSTVTSNEIIDNQNISSQTPIDSTPPVDSWDVRQ